MSTISRVTTSKVSLSKLLSGALLIAGTSIGAGMLGIPMVTCHSGFAPAALTTVSVWLLMLVTGLLFLEVTLKMPQGSNILSITHYYLGKQGKLFAGIMFAFLYYCLLVAYIAGGTPLFKDLLPASWMETIPSGFHYALFTMLIGFIVFRGARWIDRANILLSIGMFTVYFLIIFTGLKCVSMEKIAASNFSTMLPAIPVLFGAFGYHNVIPSLSDYLQRDRKTLQLSLISGTLIALVIYLAWQYLIIGSVSKEALNEAMLRGQTSVFALQEVANNPKLFLFGKVFAMFALITSLLGVSLSMVDFFADGFKLISVKVSRAFLCLVTFLPPLIFTILNPTIFTKALGIAGGFGEACLNAILPVALFWMSRYVIDTAKETKDDRVGKIFLSFLFVLGIGVVFIELNEVFPFF